MEDGKSQNQSVPPDLAVWIADIIQIKTLAGVRPISDEHADLIQQSANRLMDILDGRLSADLRHRMTAVAIEMAEAVARAA
jgi:hypothetical protein